MGRARIKVSVSMWWSGEQQASIEAALRAAAQGSPRMLSIEGDAGQGKTALLQELIRRADGFHVLSGEGVEETSPRSLDLLRGWVDIPDELRGRGAGFPAAQHLRRRIDELANTGPVLLVVDDLQWVDADSVEALAWVLRRATGDRLLLAAAHRGRSASTPPAWRQLMAELDPVQIRLTGMELSEATALARALVPTIPDGLVERLREHTGGNPLYLRSLLTEYDSDELDRLETLPAPGYLTASVTERRLSLPTVARDLLDATTILGTGWSPLPLVAELANIDDNPEAAASALIATDLILARGHGPRREVRIAHALVRAAVYESFPDRTRHDLHLRAADLVTSTSDRLRHRVAATSRYDAGFSDELDAHANDLHGRGHYAEAAYFQLASSGVTGPAELREKRWLDGLFELVLARDTDALTPHLSQVPWATDDVRRVLVEAGSLIIQRHWLAASRLLDSVPEPAIERTDSTTRYRLLVLRSWARVVTGPPAESVLDTLNKARTEPGADHALSRHFAFAFGQARMATTPLTHGWALADVTQAEDKPLTANDRTRLAWRGMYFALGGRLDEGIRDLTEVTKPSANPGAILGEGVFHAVLGYAHWLRGDWDRAAVTIAVAADAKFEERHPMVLAVAPLQALRDGDYGLARIQLATARRALARAPWPAAVEVVATITALLSKLDPDHDDPARILPLLRGEIGEAVTTVRGVVSPLWILHLGLLHLWSGDTVSAQTTTSLLDSDRHELPWLAAARTWLAGLLDENSGRTDAARRNLAAASAGGLPSLPPSLCSSGRRPRRARAGPRPRQGSLGRLGRRRYQVRRTRDPSHPPARLRTHTV